MFKKYARNIDMIIYEYIPFLDVLEKLRKNDY
jgi:hypothetical protein